MAQAQPDSRATPKRMAFSLSLYPPRAYFAAGLLINVSPRIASAFDQNTKDTIIARELHS